MRRISIILFSLLIFLSITMTAFAANKEDVTITTAKTDTEIVETIGDYRFTVDKRATVPGSNPDRVEVTLTFLAQNLKGPNTGSGTLLLPTVLLLIGSGGLIVLMRKKVFKAALALCLLAVLLPLASQPVKAAEPRFATFEEFSDENKACFSISTTNGIKTNTGGTVEFVSEGGTVVGFIWNNLNNGKKQTLTYVLVLKDVVSDSYINDGSGLEKFASSYTEAGYLDAAGIEHYFDYPNNTFISLAAVSTVRYDANGGSGTIARAPARRGTTMTAAPATTFTRTSYEFVEWNTAADGSGTSYAAGQTFTLTSDVTLYAQWRGYMTVTLVGFFTNPSPWRQILTEPTIRVYEGTGVNIGLCNYVISFNDPIPGTTDQYYLMYNLENESFDFSAGILWTAGLNCYTLTVNEVEGSQIWLSYNGVTGYDPVDVTYPVGTNLVITFLYSSGA